MGELEIGKAAGSIRDFHAVRFFNDSDSLCRLVGDFISDGITNGQPAVVIARPRHREDIARHLRACAIDTSKLEQQGDLACLAAALERLPTADDDGRVWSCRGRVRQARGCAGRR